MATKYLIRKGFLMQNKLKTPACTGCNACYSTCPVNAISMIENKEGFKYPQIDSNKCIKCGACLAGCKFGAIVKE